jgi:AcrR family transcriptional regulator
MGANRRDATSFAHHEDILLGAEAAFVERGFAKTTIDHIAAAAGVAKGTVYLHFASKDALVAALRVRHNERITARLDNDRMRRLVRPRQLLRVARTYVHVAVEHADLFRVLFQHAGVSEVDPHRPLSRYLADLLDAAAAEDEFDVGDAHATAIFVLDGLRGVTLDVLRDATGPHVRLPGIDVLLLRALGVVGPSEGGLGRLVA